MAFNIVSQLSLTGKTLCLTFAMLCYSKFGNIGAHQISLICNDHNNIIVLVITYLRTGT